MRRFYRLQVVRSTTLHWYWVLNDTACVSTEIMRMQLVDIDLLYPVSLTIDKVEHIALLSWR